MSATMTETLQSVQPMETLQLKHASSTHIAPHPPSMPKPKGKLRLDPQRALEPARKKLSTLEGQRIMAVLVETIRRSQLVSALPHVLENLDRYRILLGVDLVKQLEEHRVIVNTFNEMRGDAEKFLEREDRASAQGEDGELKDEGVGSRPASAASAVSQSEMTLRNLSLVAQQMQHSCKCIMRAFSLNPAAMNSVLDAQGVDRTEESVEMIFEMNELKDIILHKLLTTPVEESERNQYLREISDRERHHATVIEKQERELQAAQEDKENEIRKKNDIIRKLQADLHQIEKFSEEHIRRTKSEAEKQEAADNKNSEGKQQKLQQETAALKAQLQTLTTEHRENEQELRRKKLRIETEVENWIQKYDKDMGERQDEYEEIDAVYTQEKKQLNELEERFKTLEEEYTQIMEERRVARERREAAERELARAVRAATTIQAFWRSYKVRKALKSKKKKKGKKGKK